MLLCSQAPTIGHYPELHESSPHLHNSTLFFKIHCNIILQCMYVWLPLLCSEALPKDKTVETDIHKSNGCFLLQLPHQPPSKLCCENYSDVQCFCIPVHQLNIREILHDSKSKKLNGCWKNMMWCVDFWTMIEMNEIRDSN